MRRLTAVVLLALVLILGAVGTATAHNCGFPTGATETDADGTVWEEWVSVDGETYWSERPPPWKPPADPPGSHRWTPGPDTDGPITTS